MKISVYDIDLEKVAKEINSKKYEKILLQVPEGLKIHLSKFLEFFEKETKAAIFVSADPCFGACDVVNSEIYDLGIDLVVQIGHTQIPNIKKYQIKTMFVNALYNLDISDLIEKSIKKIKGKKIGIVATAQHVNLLNNAAEILKKNNFDPIIGKGDDRVEYPGQILGCNFSAAKSIRDQVDAFLYIGDGSFHPLGLILSTKKPVIICDPYTKQVKYEELDNLKDIILRQRYGAISRASSSKMFGILIGTKKGQQRIKQALEIKEKLASKNKKSVILIANYFDSAHLQSFRDIDCFISTACPRIAIDDYMQYKIPILTPIELDMLLDIKKWEDYKFDEIIEGKL